MHPLQPTRIVEFEELWLRGSAAMRLSGKHYGGEYGVWLELASALAGKEKTIPEVGGRKYDWSGKICLKLTRYDLSKIGWAVEHSSRNHWSPFAISIKERKKCSISQWMGQAAFLSKEENKS